MASIFSKIAAGEIPSVMSSKPLDDANCEWKEVNPETVGDASATGYYRPS